MNGNVKQQEKVAYPQDRAQWLHFSEIINRLHFITKCRVITNVSAASQLAKLAIATGNSITTSETILFAKEKEKNKAAKLSTIMREIIYVTT